MFEDWMVWLILGLLLLAAEVVVPGIVLVFFGLGALLTALLAATDLVPDVGFQLILFALSSGAGLLLLRRLFRSLFSGTTESLKLEDEFVGREARVLTTIPAGGEGRVEIKGAAWRARSESELNAGSLARVVRRDNLLIWVEPIG